MLIITALIAALCIWVVLGIFILRRGSRATGTAFHREIGCFSVSVGDPVPVTLTVRPQAQSWLVQPHDVVILIDNSGSMGSAPGSPLWTTRRALTSFIQRLPSPIHVALISFDHEARRLSNLTDDRRAVVTAIEGVRSGGGTAIHLALDCARDVLSSGRQGVQRSVVLLSDGSSGRPPALEAAGKLGADFEGAQLIAIGVGAAAEADLLEQLVVQCGAGRYVALRRVEDIEPLFECLAAVVSNGGAWSGVVLEPIPAPALFDLNRAVGCAPHVVSVGDGRSDIAWCVPALDAEPAVIGYELIARAPGWHAVAHDGATLLWKLPDGSTQEIAGPRGPKVLVSPRGMGWAWPVFNPLFWLLFSSIFKPRSAHSAAVPAPAPEPAGDVSAVLIPSLPAAPAKPAYQAAPEPALIVGLGAFGERVANRYGELLIDRGQDVGASPTSVVVVRLGDPIDRPAVDGFQLGAGHQINICVDLRAAVEARRAAGRELEWLESGEVLRRSAPLNTVYGALGDRRLARLAAIEAAGTIGARLLAEYNKVKLAITSGAPPLVALVGSADDPEGAGMIAEIAHILAADGVGVTAVLATASVDAEDDPGALGLSIELERMIALSGVSVYSEARPGQAVRRLFDRALIVPGYEDPALRVENVAGLLWCLTTVRQLPEMLRPLRTAAVDIKWLSLPDLGFWRWVRAQALRVLMCERWLGLQGRTPAFPLEADVEATVKLFLRPADGGQLPGVVARLAAMLMADNFDPARLLLIAEAAALPVEAPEHMQIVWCDTERSANLAHLRIWAEGVLSRERAEGRWGLPLLAASLTTLAGALRNAQQKIDRVQTSVPALGLRAQFLSSMLLDLRGQVDALRRATGRWIAQIAGSHPTLTAEATPPAVPAAAIWLAESSMTASVIDTMPAAARPAAEACVKRWMDMYGAALSKAVTFVVEQRNGQVVLDLSLADRRIGPTEDLTARLFALFDAYRDEVRKWPVPDAFSASALTGPTYGGVRVGRYADRIIAGNSSVNDASDPFIVAALSWREDEVVSTLGLKRTGRPPVYVHAEEANAAKLLSRVRAHMHEAPRQLPPLARAALRDPMAAWAFFSGLALGRLREQGERWLWDKGGGAAIDLGPITGQSSLEVFESLVRRALINDPACAAPVAGSSIDDWRVVPAAAWSQLTSQPLLREAEDDQAWGAWRIVVLGLALEYGCA